MAKAQEIAWRGAGTIGSATWNSFEAHFEPRLERFLPQLRGAAMAGVGPGRLRAILAAIRSVGFMSMIVYGFMVVLGRVGGS
jgi:hypothetical protein